MKKLVPTGLAILVLALGLAACSQAAGRSRGTNQDLLTRDEITQSEASNLYDAVQRLRPRWLTVRGGARSMNLLTTDILVFQDQTLLGNIEVLRQLTPGMVHTLKYLDAATASATLPGIGSRHVAAAIVLQYSPGR